MLTRPRVIGMRPRPRAPRAATRHAHMPGIRRPALSEHNLPQRIDTRAYRAPGTGHRGLPGCLATWSCTLHALAGRCAPPQTLPPECAGSAWRRQRRRSEECGRRPRIEPTFGLVLLAGTVTPLSLPWRYGDALCSSCLASGAWSVRYAPADAPAPAPGQSARPESIHGEQVSCPRAMCRGWLPRPRAPLFGTAGAAAGGLCMHEIRPDRGQVEMPHASDTEAQRDGASGASHSSPSPSPMFPTVVPARVHRSEGESARGVRSSQAYDAYCQEGVNEAIALSARLCLLLLLLGPNAPLAPRPARRRTLTLLTPDAT